MQEDFSHIKFSATFFRETFLRKEKGIIVKVFFFKTKNSETKKIRFSEKNEEKEDATKKVFGQN